MKRHGWTKFLLATAALATLSAADALTIVAPGEAVATPAAMTDRIIVKLRSAYRGERVRNQAVAALDADRTGVLSASAGIVLRAVRPMSDDAQVVALPRALRNETVQAVVDRLRNDPTVEYAYVDVREHLMAVPNDPSFPQQTYLRAPGAAPTVPAVNAPAAWDVTKGTAAAPVAIVDGGVRFDHPDLAGRLLAGYDFVSADCTIGSAGCTTTTQFTTANDGDGRDADASDPGDWVTAADVASNPILSSCTPENSTWHGTHIAGIIGATGNNALGVTGLNWNAALLPVRVSGRCGGYRSDVVDGMRWAAGLAVPNVPANPTPARVINVSLGSAGNCTSTAYGQAVTDVIATGAIVVAAAGNEDSGVILPASCAGVVSVGAVRGDGTRAVYSNSGPGLTIMAPGGDYTSATNDRLFSTNNAGSTTPVGYSSGGYYVGEAGTSFSTPVVSGVVSLMLSANPTLTGTQVTDILRATARPFVAVAGFATCVAGGGNNTNNTTPCNCTSAACGAGYVDAAAAVTRASVTAGGIAAPAAPAAPVTPVTAPATPVATSSGGGGGGGGGGLDPTGVLVLVVIGIATRHLRARPDRES